MTCALLLAGAVLIAMPLALAADDPACEAEPPSSPTVEWKDAPGEHLTLLFEGHPVVRYMYAFDTSTKDRGQETYKVYLHVFDPEAGTLLTKGPGGRYTHHRGVFIGWKTITYDGGTKHDWWHMKDVAQIHQKVLLKDTAQQGCTLTTLIHWNDPEGKPVITEERTHIVRVPASGPADSDFPVVLDVISKLTAVRSDVVLGGDPEHAGCQFRPSNEVAENKSAAYQFPSEDTDVKTAKDLPWAGLQFKLGDATYCVEHMNHPANPKGTVSSAYRDYGRFGAFAKAEIKKGETLTLRYGVRVDRGEMRSREAMQKAYEAFVARLPAK